VFSGEAFAVLVYPLLAGVALGALVRRRADRPKVVCMALFGVYLIEVLRVTLFPIPVDGLMARDFASIPFMTFANFVPIVPLFDTGTDPSQLVQNVMLGVPFGFGAWFVIKRPTLRRVLGQGVAVFLVIELMQGTIGRIVGFMYRVIDINDLTLNSLGVIVGIVLFYGFGAVVAFMDARQVVAGGGPYWDYLVCVARRASRSTPKAGSLKPDPAENPAEEGRLRGQLGEPL